MKENTIQYRMRKIIDIAHLTGNGEMACKRCGVISKVEDVIITDRGKHVRADCPDCFKFMKFLPQTSLPRVFNFNTNEMIDLMEAPTPILKYHLDQAKGKTELLDAINQELIRRLEMDLMPPVDFEPGATKGPTPPNQLNLW